MNLAVDGRVFLDIDISVFRGIYTKYLIFEQLSGVEKVLKGQGVVIDMPYVVSDMTIIGSVVYLILNTNENRQKLLVLTKRGFVLLSGHYEFKIIGESCFYYNTRDKVKSYVPLQGVKFDIPFRKLKRIRVTEYLQVEKG